MAQKKTTKQDNQLQVVLYVVGSIREGIPIKEIVYRLKISKQAIAKHLKFLKSVGIISKKGYAVWEITPFFEQKSLPEIQQFIDDKKRRQPDSSSGMRNPKNRAILHALNIVIPVVEGRPVLEGGYDGKLKNWTRRYKRYPEFGYTLVNNNDKSVGVYIWSREITDLFDIPGFCHRVVHFVCQDFKNKGVVLDYFGWRVTTFHVSMRNDVMDKILNKGLKVELLLGRDVERIGEKDITQEAKVWVDSSPYKGVETNDLRYFQSYMLMPERVERIEGLVVGIDEKILPVVDEMAVNLKTHVKVLKDISRGFGKFNRLLSERQSRLGDFLG